MQCPVVIAILDFLTGKKKTHEKSLYMINHVIIHIQLKRLNQAVFSQNAFLLRVLYWTMLYSSDHNEFFIWPQWIFYMTIMNSLYPNISESFLLGSLPSQTTFLKRTYLKFQFIRRHTDTSRHVEDNASNVPDKSGTVWSTGFWEENWNKNGWGRNYWQIQNDDNNKLSLNSRWPITNATGDHI